MNYGKRIKLSLPMQQRATLKSDSDCMGDEFDDEGGKNCKRVNRNLSEKKRRDQFNMLVNELCSMVSTTNKKMDKSTVLKSTIAFLKSYQETAVQAQAHEIKEDWKPSFLSNDEFMHLMLEAMDSFLLVFTQQGTILYVSESVTSLLGHLPNDLVNETVYEFIHENEKQNLYNILFHFSMAAAGDLTKEDENLSFSCHFVRGSMSSQESPVYEIVKFSGFQHWSRDKLLTLDEDSAQFNGLGGSSSESDSCFCCTVRLQNSQIIREMSVVDEAKSEFTSRHSLEWKFLFLDHRASPIIGYLPFEVLGTSGYDYYHPDDLEKIAKCHEQLMQTGEGMSTHYRFLTKGQQWIWIRTRYYITYHQWNSKPEFIVCSNFVVSYADVKDHVKRDLDTENTTGAGGHLKHRRSPSQCSVSSGGRPHSSWSSSHSVESTQDRNVSGSQISDKESADNVPHSTHITKSNLPNTISQHIQLLLQQRYLQQHQQQAATTMSHQIQHPLQNRTAMQGIDTQGMLSISSDKVGMFAGKPSVQHNVVPAVTQVPIMTTMLNSNVQMQGVIQSPDSTGVQPQLHLTPVQRQLHEQLREKSIKLQKTIRKQQEELQQIVQQLAMAQQGIFPVLAITTGNPGVYDTQPIMQQPKTVNAPLAAVTMPGIPLQMPSLAPVIPIQPAPQLPPDQFLPFQLLPQEAEYMLSYSSDSPNSSLPG